jgi:hypothetical protein
MRKGVGACSLFTKLYLQGCVLVPKEWVASVSVNTPIPNNDLKVAHCVDIACTSATITTLDSVGKVSIFTSITIGVDGLPIISYYGGGNLKVARCSNAFCLPYFRRR